MDDAKVLAEEMRKGFRKWFKGEYGREPNESEIKSFDRGVVISFQVAGVMVDASKGIKVKF